MKMITAQTISFTASVSEEDIHERMALEVLDQIGGLDSDGNANVALALALGVIDFTQADRPAVGFGVGTYDGDTSLGLKGFLPINNNWSATLGIAGDTDGDDIGGAAAVMIHF